MRTLLLIGIGPVQEFIEHARRMRDLWMGSHILSEMARASADCLAKDDWHLIFPAFEAGSEDLKPCPSMWGENGSRPTSVANKILAVCPNVDDAGVRRSAQKARQAAVHRWQEFAHQAKVNAAPLLATHFSPGHAPQEVVEDLLEFIVAWSCYEPEDAGGYGRAMAAVERQLASRKVLRDFEQWRGHNGKKSSLDGFRESILIDQAAARPKKEVRKYRLGEAEQLDGVGVVKRMGGAPEQFVPIARVALAPWIQRLIQREQAQTGKSQDVVVQSWTKLVEACERFDVPRCDLGAAAWMPRRFPFDGEIFYEGQWPNLSFGQRCAASEEEQSTFGRDHVATLLKHLSHRGSTPCAYVACLVADGDWMGRSIRTLPTDESHSQFSAALSEYSRHVREIVEAPNHLGVLVYAGGDEVLAFVPVETAHVCAASLNTNFTDKMRKCFPEGEAPTLSVGIGIGHVLTPMGELLTLGRRALEQAKGDASVPEKDRRNALAMILDKRSGGTLTWRSQWPRGPVERLEKLVARFALGQIPRKLPYELRNILARYPDFEQTSLKWGSWIGRELERLLARKRPSSPTAPRLTPTDLDFSPAGERYGEVRDQAEEWIRGAMIAQAIGDARRATTAINESDKERP